MTRMLRQSLTRFMIRYKFAMQELGTRIDILAQEFQSVHEHSPIEHVKQRLKTPESILNKVERKGYQPTLESIRLNIRDIAGIRVSCSFVPDIYRVAGMLMQQKDITVVEYKDYVENPKPNGYRSLHMIVEIPVYFSDRVEDVCVELQLRTVAMDFWASLEHKIYYKYDRSVPDNLHQELLEAAADIEKLDAKMQRLHAEMQQLKVIATTEDPDGMG